MSLTYYIVRIIIFSMQMQEGEIDPQDQTIVAQQNIQTDAAKRKRQRQDIVSMLKSNPTRLKHLRDSLKFFTLIRKNIYLERKRKLPKSDEIQPCYCRPRQEEETSYEHSNVSYNCGERCLNRMMSTQCDDETCNCGELCQNRKFQKHQYACVYPKPTPGKGWGLFAGQKIYRGDFIMQYIGEVFSTNSEHGKARVKQYSNSTCTYLMKTSKGEVIDPTYKGNLARFINHSCQPNCITQKWNVLGQICIGIFSLKDIQQNQQLNFDYQFDVYSTPLTKCLCGAKKCKGYLGLKPTDITAEEWNERLEDMTCEICQKNEDNDDATLIICDQCNKGYHIYCLDPPLSAIPQQSFFCKACMVRKEEEKRRMEREQIERLRDTKMSILQDQARRRQEESSDQSISPPDENYNRVFSFMKKQQKKVAKQLLGEKVQQEEEPQEQTLTPKKKKTPTPQVKKTPPVKKRKDQFYQVSKRAIDKFQGYLQQNQQFYQQIINFGSKKQHKTTQDEKKTLLLNRVQMQLILKSNFILFQKIGAQIYFDINSRSATTDFFLKSIQVSVIGNQQQIAMFQRIVEVTNEIINQLQVEMGITEAYMAVPAIFLKKLIGPGHIFMNQIQRTTQVAIYYHKKFINQDCYPLQVTCKLLLKGGKENIVRAYEQIQKRVSVLQVQRLYFNPYEIKTIMNNEIGLRRKPGMAEFRIGKESPFKDVNHPFFYIQQKNKEILMIGCRAEIQKTRRQIMYFFQQPNRKEEYNFNISLYLAQSSHKSSLVGVKNRLQRDIPAIKMMIFDPTPPRKNMTLSFLGTRQNRQKAREYLFEKMEEITGKQGRYGGNLEAFQDQMNYQMTKYYFKYMQNALLTKDSAFMKSWDILNSYYVENNSNYMWKSIKRALQYDYETLLYACFVLKEQFIQKILRQSHSQRSVLQEVYEVIRHNIGRLLSSYNISNTSALRNYASVVDGQQAKRLFRDSYSNINFLKGADASYRIVSIDSQKHIGSQSYLAESMQDGKRSEQLQSNGIYKSIFNREQSYFQKKFSKKFHNLLVLIDEERQRSREKDEDQRKQKWK